MNIPRGIVLSLVGTSLLFSSAFAQTNPLPTSTPPQSSSNSGGSALGIGLAVGAGVVGIGLLSSVSSFFVSPFTSFGGRVTVVVPCTLGVLPMLYVTVLSNRGGIPHPEFYIWTPATLTKLAGPPTHPGQQILGLADVPLTCFIGGGLFVLPVPLVGLRMMTVGTSVI